jgi:hypothetical protein
MLSCNPHLLPFHKKPTLSFIFLIFFAKGFPIRFLSATSLSELKEDRGLKSANKNQKRGIYTMMMAARRMGSISLALPFIRRSKIVLLHEDPVYANIVKEIAKKRSMELDSLSSIEDVQNHDDIFTTAVICQDGFCGLEGKELTRFLDKAFPDLYKVILSEQWYCFQNNFEDFICVANNLDVEDILEWAAQGQTLFRSRMKSRFL